MVFSVANQKAMTFVGGGAANWTQWAEFLGLVKDKRFPHAGSPFQVAAVWLYASACVCGRCGAQNQPSGGVQSAEPQARPDAM